MRAPKPLRAIFLTGMMGSGKTTVGRLLAKRLGWRFVDTDALIRRRAGKSIPAIFESKGEAQFRRLESQTLKSLRFGGPAVVATGGGMVIKASNRAWMKRHGMVVHLKAGPKILAKRLGKTSKASRPLLRGGLKALQTLARRRAKFYALADLVVPASQSPVAVAARLERACLGTGLVLQ